MKIIVFGASGKVGRLVVDVALRRGHDVTAFVHSQEVPSRTGLINIKGDIYDRSSVESALEGQEVVISALGSWGTDEKNVLSTAMQMIIPAAESRGLHRLVSLTGAAAQVPGEKNGLPMIIGRLPILTVNPKILRDGEDHIALLANSSLDWTVVRSGIMLPSPYDNYGLSHRSGWVLISRRAVATAMVDLAESNEWLRSAPFIRRG